MTIHMSSKKTVYIARVADGNSDSYTAAFSRETAKQLAEIYKAHLTPGELNTHTVSVEAYEIECAEGADAENAYRDALLADAVGDPVEYRVV